MGRTCQRRCLSVEALRMESIQSGVEVLLGRIDAALRCHARPSAGRVSAGAQLVPAQVFAGLVRRVLHRLKHPRFAASVKLRCCCAAVLLTVSLPCHFKPSPPPIAARSCCQWSRRST